MDLCSATPSIPIFFFAPNSVFWPAGCEEKLSPKLPGLELRNAQEKSKSHELPACLTAARTPREINTKFQSQKCADRANTRPEKKLLIPLLWLIFPPNSRLSHSSHTVCTQILFFYFSFPCWFVPALLHAHTRPRAQYLHGSRHLTNTPAQRTAVCRTPESR